MMDSPAHGAPRTWREIHLAPVAQLDEGTLERLALELSKRSALPCRAVPPPLAGELPRVPNRPQLDADRLLVSLEPLAEVDAPLVGITAVDIAVPIFAYVFGRARLGGRAVMISLARLDPEHYGLPRDPGLVARRAAAEILHELGHAAGLAHCEDPACLMRFAASVEAADLRGATFCADCAARLPHGLVRSTAGAPQG